MGIDDLDNIKAQREATRQRLRVIEQQIAQFGEKWAPAHLLTERAEARESIARYETVLRSALPPSVGDELGESGRFILYLEELRNVQQSVALYGYQLGEHISETGRYRAAHATEHSRARRWVIAAVVLVALLIAFALGRLI